MQQLPSVRNQASLGDREVLVGGRGGDLGKLDDQHSVQKGGLGSIWVHIGGQTHVAGALSPGALSSEILHPLAFMTLLLECVDGERVVVNIDIDIFLQKPRQVYKDARS